MLPESFTIAYTVTLNITPVGSITLTDDMICQNESGALYYDIPVRYFDNEVQQTTTIIKETTTKATTTEVSITTVQEATTIETSTTTTRTTNTEIQEKTNNKIQSSVLILNTNPSSHKYHLGEGCSHVKSMNSNNRKDVGISEVEFLNDTDQTIIYEGERYTLCKDCKKGKY